MKFYSLIIIIFFNINNLFTQNSETYTSVKERVSKNFFKTPEIAKKDCYLLLNLSKTNQEIQTSYKYLGYVYDLTGKVDSARFYLNKRLSFNKINFTNQLEYYESVISYSNWGIESVDSKVLIEELTTALSSIKYEEHQQEKGLMYMLLGDILLRDNDLDNANSYYDKAFKLIKGKYVQVDYYLRKSSIAIRKNNYLEAETFLHKGISYLDDKNVYTYPSYLNDLGYVSLMLRKFNNAEKYLKESIHYQSINNFKTFTTKTYLYLAYLAKEIDPVKEKNYLDKSLEFSNKDPIATKEIYLAYKGYYERNKNFKLEQKYLRKFNRLNDSLFNKEKAKIKLDLEWRYKLNESNKKNAFNEQIISHEKKIKNLYVFALVLSVMLMITLIIVFWTKNKVHRKNQKIQKLLHEEELKNTLDNQITEVIKEKIKTKVEERERLSLELHDGIANEISALKLSLSNPKNIKDPLISSTINKIDKLYNQVRNLSHDLNPDNITEIEFTQLVHKICAITENTGIKVHKNIIISKNIDNLDEKKLLNLYRIIQELINNLVKHSKATIASVEILETDTTIFLEISDNGIGFNNTKKLGIGLRNIKKRVTYLNGTITTTSENGTKTTINIPI